MDGGLNSVDKTSVQYQMWRFICDFDHGYDLTLEARFARENCNDRGEVLNHEFAYRAKFEMINYFYFCHQALSEQGLLPDDIGQPDEVVDDGDPRGTVSLKKKEFRLINAPFPAPPLLGRMWELWILYSRQYREFCLKFFGGILVRRVDTSKEAFQAYQEFRSQATIDSWERLWPEYETYEDFLFEHESPVVWIGLQQKTEFLQFVSDEYNKMANAGSEKTLTEMSKEICDKYLAQIYAEAAAKDDKLGEVDDELKLGELGPELPETAKPDVMAFLHRKV